MNYMIISYGKACLYNLYADIIDDKVIHMLLLDANGTEELLHLAMLLYINVLT